jgi:hypothetical protein
VLPRTARVQGVDRDPLWVEKASSLEERAMLEERGDLEHRGFWLWSREDTHRYFLAGGGREGDFDALWSVAIGSDRKFDQAIAERTYARGRRYQLSCCRQKARA